MTAHQTDVLVIGGGPAGSVAAFQLASAGVAVTLVDRVCFPRDKVCGESLSPGALQRLSTIGMWEPDARDPLASSPARAMNIRGMRIRSPRGTTFLGRYRGGAGGTGFAIRRSVLDAELLSRARGVGARVMEGIEILRAELDAEGGARVHGRSRDGSIPVHFSAKRVVVADGRQSFVARHLGFIEPERVRSARRYAVRAHFDGVQGLSDLAEMQVGLGGYCGIAPLSPTSANVCYVLFGPRVDITPRTIEEDFGRHLRAFPDVAARLQAASMDGRIRVVGPLRLRSRRHAQGPFIACGDTTGFLDPFTGEGIAHAIASGVLGASAVRDSLNGHTRAFADYEREVRALRRVKGVAALVLHGLIMRPSLANSAALAFARLPRLGNAVVQLFGDAV